MTGAEILRELEHLGQRAGAGQPAALYINPSWRNRHEPIAATVRFPDGYTLMVQANTIERVLDRLAELIHRKQSEAEE